MFVSVATELVLLRHARRLPMRAYARELGISQPALVDLEHGRNYPAPETLRAYARMVGVPAERLLEAEEQDRALAALTATPEAAKRLAAEAAQEIARVRQILGAGRASREDLTPGPFLRLQYSTPKCALDLRRDPALARCWNYLAYFVLARADLPLPGPPGALEDRQKAAPGAPPTAGNPHDRADLVRLCFSRVRVALGPGQAVTLEFEGISRDHGGG